MSTAVPPVPPAPAAIPRTETTPQASSIATPAPATTLPRATLLETEVVHGDGPEAYASPLAIGADDAGAGGVPLVEEPPVQEKPREPISREKAALVAKIVTAYVGFGWRQLAQGHEDAIASVVDTFVRAYPDLARLSSEQKFQMGMGLMLGQVEESAIALAIKYNVSIPYADEAIVGASVGTATLGVMRAFSGPKNDNERAHAARDANPTPAPAPARDVPRDVPEDNADNEDNAPTSTVRATNRGPQ